jgi:hypothetical protein
MKVQPREQRAMHKWLFKTVAVMEDNRESGSKSRTSCRKPASAQGDQGDGEMRWTGSRRERQLKE